MSSELNAGRVAGEAMAHAMYPFTFGIVSDLNGQEGKGIGTGVGVQWCGTYLIATARHVIQDTAPQRIYYFLPQSTVQVRDSYAPVDWAKVKLLPRVALENPAVIHGVSDIAAILLPKQLEPASSSHFYRLDDSHITPPAGTSAGYMGYPAAAARPFGANFAVMPSHGLGAICAVTSDDDETTECAVTYASGDELDPHGFSGSGIWFSGSSGRVWSPMPTLGGIVTHYRRQRQMLIGCRVEVLTAFLAANL